jgi:predicted MFS family arabinose efflux permease
VETGGVANWGAVYAMSLCVFVLIASEFMPVSLLSPIASDLHLTEGQAGQVISASGFFAFLTSLLMTSFIGRTDRHYVMLALTGLLIVSSTLVAFAPNYAILLIGRAVLGIAIGGFWSMATALVMRLVPPASVPKAFAVMNGGNAIASIVAVPLGSFVGGLVGWHWALSCVAPVALVALIWQAFAIPRLPPAHEQKKGRLLALLSRRPVVIGFVCQMVFFGGMFAVFTYLRPFLEQVTHVGIGPISAMLLLVGISGFIGTLLVARVICDRISRLLATLASILAVTAVCLALFGGSLPVTVVLLAIWGLIFTSAPVAWSTWLSRSAPDDPEAGGALMVAGGQIAIVIGASFGGMVFDAFGVKAEFLTGAATLLIAALLALASDTQDKPRSR